LPSRHSFTTLSRFAAAEQLDPDAAAVDEREADPGAVLEADVYHDPGVPHPQIEALASLRGADFGNAVHAVFERRVVALPMFEQRDLLRQQLALYNILSRELSTEQVIERLSKRLQQVLDAPLDPQTGLSLAALQGADLRVEMEFNFALQGASMRRLQAICRQPDGSSLVPGSQRSLAGLMTGKIDLCFRHDGRVHVLDYKGNYLGDCIEDYQGESLNRTMDASHYRFQALLYTVAVDRYLRQRIPDYRRALHLGDCWYLFIRAVGLAPDAGIWRHRFDDALLDAVDAELAHGLQGEPA
jgi:exodeoxyribonuclease V beta subunit